jgi:hypothetical protein
MEFRSGKPEGRGAAITRKWLSSMALKGESLHLKGDALGSLSGPLINVFAYFAERQV